VLWTEGMALENMMKPLRNNVLVAQMKEDKTSAAGIIIAGPDTASKNGKVMAVGDECVFVKVGDTVVPDWSKSKQTVVNGIQCVVLSEDDIHAIIE
jgi:co-chaperonin GroES (HSP10)